MRSSKLSLLLATLVATFILPVSLAFTNGSLIPSYICDVFDQANGAPTSLGQVVPYLHEDDAMVKVAKYHYHFQPPFAALDLCTAMLVNATSVQQTSTFQITVKNTTQKMLGLIVWVQDFPAPNTPRHIGTITHPGLNMMHYPWRGCGRQGSTIVHSKPLDDGNPTPQMSGPFTWTLGADGIAGNKVQVRGVCITEGKGGTQGGYGKFAVDFPVTSHLANTFWGFAHW